MEISLAIRLRQCSAQMVAVHTFPHAGLYGRRRLAAKARQGILLLMLR